MSQGRIDVKLDQTVVDEVMAYLALIRERLPFLVRLSNSEKQRLVKPQASAQQVIQTIIDLQHKAGLVSGDDAAVLADLSVFTGLTTISDTMSDLLRRIDDTKLLAGSEGWNESLIRYGMLRQVERRNPEVKAGLDRVRPLISRRATRLSPESPEPIDAPDVTTPDDDTPAR
jgi:hypothetical protein